MDPILEELIEITEAANWDSDHDETFFNAIDEIRDEAISAFAFERLQSYYRDQEGIRVPPLRALEKAKLLLQHDPSASLVLAITSAEVCIKNLILRPMVYGLVHQPYAAKLIADLALSQTGWDRFSGLLKEILREKVGVDLNEVKIQGTATPLWVEFKCLVKARNGVVHRAEEVTSQQANAGIRIANELINIVFPRLLASIGLQVDENGSVQSAQQE